MPLVSIPKDVFHCKNLIAGEWTTASSQQTMTVDSPYSGTQIAKVEISNASDVNQAVASAKEAFTNWRNTPIKERTSLLLNFRNLLLRDIDELAHTTALESGKTPAEGKAGILKGIEVLEFAASLQNLDIGGSLEVSRGVSCEYRREPLGVVVGIVPFNFPAMVPMWMFPIAVTLGNCFIMKPSEKVPITMNKIAKLMQEAGYPNGVFTLVNGTREAVEALIDHHQVKAVAFVGSSPVAQAVYQRTTSLGKRCLALGGAKNPIILAPDADEALTTNGIIGSFCGCAGQRCMAASILIAVGDVGKQIDRIVEQASRLVTGEQMGAIIDEAARTKIIKAIQRAQEQGADVRLDGSKVIAPKSYEGGYWIGPTIIDNATPEMDCCQEEIFGPVIAIIRVESLKEALAIENKSKFGNAVSVFTTDGAVAQYVSDNAMAGMIGVNIGVPVPREPFSFGGTKDSKFGQGDITGTSSLDFWSNLKKTTTKWQLQTDANWMS